MNNAVFKVIPSSVFAGGKNLSTELFTITYSLFTKKTKFFKNHEIDITSQFDTAGIRA